MCLGATLKEKAKAVLPSFDYAFTGVDVTAGLRGGLTQEPQGERQGLVCMKSMGSFVWQRACFVKDVVSSLSVQPQIGNCVRILFAVTLNDTL